MLVASDYVRTSDKEYSEPGTLLWCHNMWSAKIVENFTVRRLPVVCSRMKICELRRTLLMRRDRQLGGERETPALDWGGRQLLARLPSLPLLLLPPHLPLLDIITRKRTRYVFVYYSCIPHFMTPSFLSQLRFAWMLLASTDITAISRPVRVHLKHII